MNAPLKLKVDVVTEEVVRMAIRQISLEMAALVKRISSSTVITEADDYAVLIFSATGELLDAPLGPFFAGAGRVCLSKFLQKFTPDDYAEGDVFIANDPYSSGAHHPNDMQALAPVIVDGRCVAFTYMHAHLMDVGGILPGSWGVGAKDVFAEAFRLPFVKYRSGGVVSDTIERIIATNTRLPAMTLNDIHAMTSATHQGACQLQALVSRYGVQPFEAIVSAFIARTERAALARLASLEPRTYEVVDWMEHNGQRDDLYGIRGRLTVRPDKLIFEFTGVPQTDGFVNGTPTTIGSAVAAVCVLMLFWDIPFNEGIFHTIEVWAEKGTIVCAQEPAPLSSGHIEAGAKATTIVARLLGDAGRTSADADVRRHAHAPFAGSVTIAAFAGMDARNEFTVFMDMTGMGGGAGAAQGADGMDVSSMQLAGSISMPDIESMEDTAPVLFLWRRLAVDSGGVGEFRGGTGIDSAWMLFGSDRFTATLNSACGHIPVPGACGGYPGATTACELAEVDVKQEWFAKGRMPTPADIADGQVLPIKCSGVEMGGSDIFRMRLPGGGGYGDPLKRDPALVARDVEMQAISPLQALNAYGVALDQSAAGYSEPRTIQLRQDRREGRATLADATSAAHLHPSTQVCASCQAAGRDGLVAAPVGNAAPLAARMKSFGAYVEPKAGVLLHELVCPQCHDLLDVTYSAGDDTPNFTVPLERIF